MSLKKPGESELPVSCRLTVIVGELANAYIGPRRRRMGLD